MSDNSKKKEKDYIKEIKLKIPESLYRALERQLAAIKRSQIAKFEKVNTVDEFVSEFLQTLKVTEEEFEEMKEKFGAAFGDLERKQRIIKEIFSSFSKDWEGFMPDDVDLADEEEERRRKRAKVAKEKKN
ncbi:hypothetical protein HF1_11010 [Mycoplasma haemofelis str. Langford 1]|uniref:MRG domain-containing protein n=2 Tax=Mycoplasma haemofelis TaxID=29501 RepID=F6FJS9_MYCHI|nr:hypothetical protein [Mycoplasma haemofelis]AEG73434.1 hypothetical protein MHF_1194 [Mycoplasma haemofelis Ohio2]CBY93109.1 hypothetical protein HF1_11010 [Mycoplasma haemofelis str. Langford 1]